MEEEYTLHEQRRGKEKIGFTHDLKLKVKEAPKG